MKRFMVVALVAACGGGDTGPVSAAEAREGCQKICTRDVTCVPESESIEVCVADCVQDVGTWPRSDAFGDFADCISDQPCNGDEEVCFSEISRLPIHDEWEAACREQLLSCMEGASEEDCSLDGSDDSALLRLVAEPIMEELIACLDGADCEARLSCLEAVVEQYGIDL